MGGRRARLYAAGFFGSNSAFNHKYIVGISKYQVNIFLLFGAFFYDLEFLSQLAGWRA